MRDKWIKVRRGLIEARNYPVTHLMVVDGDDLISNRLANLVAQNPNHTPGWTVKSGYIYEDGSQFFLRHKALNTICGSTSIIAARPNDLPTSMISAESHCMLEYGHSAIEDYFESIGQSLSPVPFPAASYVTGTGENDSAVSFSFLASRKRFIKRLLNMRLLTPGKRREFGVTFYE